MRVRSRCAYLLASIVLALVSSVAAQEPQYRIRVDTAEVSVQAMVVDHLGRSVPGLRASDFEIYENGQTQAIRYFGGADAPRNVLLLFEVGNRTESQSPVRVEALNAFLLQLRPQDRTAIAGFSEQFALIMDWRQLPVPARPLDRRLDGKPFIVNARNPFAAPAVYAAIEQAASRFKTEKGHKAIIVMTDGHDSAMFAETQKKGAVPDATTDAAFQRLILNVRNAGVPLYFIAINTERNLDPALRDHEYTALSQMDPALAKAYATGVRLRMERLAEATGGRVFYPQTPFETVSLYDSISRELGSSYSLEYAPANAAPEGKFRRIEVRVRRDGAKVVQSRDGYIY